MTYVTRKLAITGLGALARKVLILISNRWVVQVSHRCNKKWLPHLKRFILFDICHINNEGSRIYMLENNGLFTADDNSMA